MLQTWADKMNEKLDMRSFRRDVRIDLEKALRAARCASIDDRHVTYSRAYHSYDYAQQLERATASLKSSLDDHTQRIMTKVMLLD